MIASQHATTEFRAPAAHAIADLHLAPSIDAELSDAVHAGEAIRGRGLRTGHRRAPTGRAPHVVIVGAGMAGLCAAYELQRRGWTYTILEAEMRHVGGRVRTARFADGLYGELGAMRIPRQHELVGKYVNDEFKLPTRPVVANSDNAFYFGRGKRVSIGQLKQPIEAGKPDQLRRAYRLNAWEAQKTPAELWDHAVVSRVRGLTASEQSDLRDADGFKTERLTELDRFSLRRMLELSGLSSEAIDYLFASSGMRALQHSAVTEFLREELSGIWSSPGFYEIVGGMELLPKAFLHRLRSKPRMGCEVVDFEQDDDAGRVAAIYRDRIQPDRLEREEADFVICTVPLPVLARLDAHRRFSPEKQLAMRELPYESATKMLIPTSTRFWEKKERIFGGTSYTDLMPGSLYYPSDNIEQNEAKTNGPGVLSVSDCWGQEARWLGHMPPSARETLVLDLLGRNLHEELLQPDNVDKDQIASCYWDSHPWAGGAFRSEEHTSELQSLRHLVCR